MKTIKISSFFLCLIAVLFYNTNELNAQDPRYTQYYNAPLRLNPAMTGVFEGSWRVGANFRTQWGAVMGQPFNTFALTADMKVNAFKDDYFGLGFSAMTDISGQGVYNTTDINISASYMKKLTGGGRTYRPTLTSFLVAGAQLGIGQRSVRWMNLTYSTQYVVDEGDRGIYDQGIYSGENPDRRATRIYPDMSAGLLWYGVLGERKSIYAGAGIFHLNRPEISLFNRTNTGSDVERLYMRFTAHAGGEMLIGGRGSAYSLLPGFVGMFQGPAMELNFGLGIRYQQPRYDDFALRFSVWTRLSNKLLADMDMDALNLIVGLDWQTFRFGVSYDINLSTLINATNGQGALEFSIIYVHISEKSRPQGCPVF